MRKTMLAFLLAPALAFADPHERFPDAEKTFREAKAILMKSYVDDSLTEDELYRAAVAGMLAGTGRKWDALLSPTELADMQADLSGNLVGIGIELDVDADKGGYLNVLGVFPGGPAEKAGIQAGDRLTRIDGKSVRGHDDIVRRIRGKAGTSITLGILRDDQALVKTLTRAPLTVRVVEDAQLPDGAALVWVRVFNERTPSLLRASLARVMSNHPRGIVLDLRANMGGLFDKMIECAGMLLPNGSPIVTELQRGHKEESVRTTGEPLVKGLPIVVLTDGQTASGAELLAGALRDDLGARIVGARTHGKWNVQRIDTLSNGYAMKYTVGVFKTPKGVAPDGKGIDPDVPVDLDELSIAKAQRTGDAQKRIAVDAQLRAALAILK